VSLNPLTVELKNNTVESVNERIVSA